MSDHINLSFAKEHQSRLQAFSMNEQQLHGLGKVKGTRHIPLRSRAPTRQETKVLPALKPQIAEH